MHENEKMKTVGYFHTQLRAKQNEPNEFPHLLTAFLSNARSVTQYALDEVKTKPGGQAWYDGIITNPNYAILKFMKSERDQDIHVKPVSPQKIVEVGVHMTLYLSGSADYRVNYVDSDGKPVEISQVMNVEPSTPKSENVSQTTKVRYEFHNWTGPEDVMALCDECYNQLLRFLDDGRKKGFLPQ